MQVKIKFLVKASRSLLPANEQDAHTTKKINLHIWDAPVFLSINNHPDNNC